MRAEKVRQIGSLEDLLALLKGVKQTSNGQYLALCPGHDDHEPSLSITEADRKLLLFCHAGCTPNAILEGIGLKVADLFLDGGGAPEAIYQYRSKDGSLLYEKVKYRQESGKKAFYQRRLTADGELVDNLEGIRRVPYNYPGVIAAIKNSDIVVYVEGEKDAETARILGYTGTTMGGTSDWCDEFKGFFRNARIVQVADNDSPGVALVHKVSKSLCSVAKSVKVVILPEGSDLTEWVSLGHGRADFEELIAEVSELVKPTQVLNREAGNMTVGAPSVIQGAGFIDFCWPQLAIRVKAERYTQDTHADLRFFATNNADDLLLWMGRVNLLSASAVTTLTRALQKAASRIPWGRILTQLTERLLDIVRRGEPPIEIWPAEDDILTPEYSVEPLLPLNHPAVIFGDYGTTKSLLGLCIAFVAQLPYHDNNLGLKVGPESTRGLFLDYEDDADSFRRRWSALSRGFNKPAMPMQYQRMTSALADQVDQLRSIIADSEIKLLIIDSLGPAARGNLNDPEPAIRYHAGLRQLGVTTLTLAHTAKDNLTKRRTIFGSVFFTNLARSVWECKAEQEAGEDEVTISLKHTKANLSRLHPPLGYRFTFTDNTINICKVDLRDTGLSGELPLTWQIRHLLRSGSLSIQDIADSLEGNADSIGRILRRMRTKGQVIKLEDDKWGLSA